MQQQQAFANNAQYVVAAQAQAHSQANGLVEIDQMQSAAQVHAQADTARLASEDAARLGSAQAQAQAGRQRAAWITAARAKIASEARQAAVSPHRHRNQKLLSVDPPLSNRRRRRPTAVTTAS